jgi:uncharacterized protein YqgQ
VCVEIFTEKTLQYPSKGSTITTASILFGGIMNYCAKKGEDVPVTWDEVYEVVENKAIEGDDFKEAQEFVIEFGKSLAFKKKGEDIEAVKKKMSELTTEKSLISQDLDQTSTVG